MNGNQEPNKPTKLSAYQSSEPNDDYEIDDEADDEVDDEMEGENKSHQENMAVYALLWVAIIAGPVARFFIEPQYQFSTTMFGWMWLVGFIISVYAVFVTGQRFRDYNLLFIFMAPFAIIFWFSVLYGAMYGKSTPKTTDNNKINTASKLNDDELFALLDDVVTQGKKEMPIKIDEATSLTDVKIDRAMRKIKISATVIFNNNVIQMNEQSFQKLKATALSQGYQSPVCQGIGIETAFKNGIQVDYMYYSQDGYYLGKYTITRQDCGY